jgi:beta-lactamase class A
MDGYDSSFSPRLSSAARKRNQWRQFQTLRPDFGQSPAPVEPPPAPRPARNASLPTFPSLSSTAPKASAPPVPPAQSTPASSLPDPGPGSWQTSFPRASAPPGASPSTQYPARPQPKGADRPSPRQFRSRSGRRGGPPPLQPHPHSTALPNASARSVAPAPVQPAGTPSAAVTPLRSLAQPAAGAAQGLGERNTPGNLTPRPPAPPRRRLGQPPLPLLYLIRLVILGVGVAAIAGTLLSVLSPSNLATPSSQDASETAQTPATGPLVAGSTATLVSDIALGQELTLLKSEVEQLATLTPGLTQTAFMVDLDTGNYVDIAGGDAIAAASTIKLPILVAFLQQVDAGRIALNQGLVLQEDQVAGGSGTMQNDPVGSRYTALEVATQMIITSDNTATNMIVDALGGGETLNQRFQTWGLEATVLRNPLPDLDGTNKTSVKDLALLMALVDQGGLLSPRSRDRMFAIMQRTINQTLIPFGIADDSLTANKTGDINSVLGDVALVDAPNGKRYILATLIQRPDNDGRASELIRRTAETAHSEFNQPVAPVGGIDPSSPEESVPAPASPDDEGTELPAPAPAGDTIDREQTPQG